MRTHSSTIIASAAGILTLGGDLTVNRMGFGAMRLTGPGIWGEPADREECKIALAWLLRRSPAMLVIPGTSRLSHLEENIAAAGIELSDEELAELGQVGAVKEHSW